MSGPPPPLPANFPPPLPGGAPPGVLPAVPPPTLPVPVPNVPLAQPPPGVHVPVQSLPVPPPQPYRPPVINYQLSRTILLTNLPKNITELRLKRWIFSSCGATQNVALLHPPNNTTNDDDGDGKADGKKEKSGSSGGIALVTMVHSDGAIKLYTAASEMNKTSGREKQGNSNIMAYIVPTHDPNVFIPTITSFDDETKKVLRDRLMNGIPSLISEKDDDPLDYSDTGIANQEITPNDQQQEQQPGNEDKKLDTTKAAAAAGGVSVYDEDVDPLNAPHILKSVKLFRQQIDELQKKDSMKRIDIVNTKLKNLLPSIRKDYKEMLLKEKEEKERREKELLRQQQQPPPPPLPDGTLPPPPLPDGALPPPPIPSTAAPPPLPEGVPPPPPPPSLPSESGRRGVSNLPAWMTKENPEAAEEAAKANADKVPPPLPNDQLPPPPPSGPPRKKPKLDLSEIMNTNSDTPTANASSSDNNKATANSLCFGVCRNHEELKAYIKTKIVEYLGEEEQTLIDFIYRHITELKSVKSLLDELQPVLDEDAQTFVDELQKKVLSI